MSIVAMVAIAASVLFLYIRFKSSNDEFREETLSTFANDLRKELLGDPALAGAHATALKTRIRELNGEYAIIGAGGNILDSSDLRQPFVPVLGDRTEYFQLPGHSGRKALFGITLPIGDNSVVGFIQIAFPREHVIFDTVLEEFVTDIAWLWIPFVLVLLATNVVVLAFALRPLSTAAQEAMTIGPSSLAKRLTEAGMPEDVLALIRSVNGALDRLQTGFLSLEQFSGQLAHELRTPLAIAKARLSLSQDDIARAVEKDFDGIERVITQLVDRFRIKTLHYELDDIVDLGEVAADVARYLAPMIIDAGCNIELRTESTPVFITGAVDYIFRALRNLIENALHHSPAQGLITVEVFKAGITVSDQGSGFPEWRLTGDIVSQGRSGRKDGLGLGLSIVAETMAAHGGRLKLENLSGGGASATMEFYSRSSMSPD